MTHHYTSWYLDIRPMIQCGSQFYPFYSKWVIALINPGLVAGLLSLDLHGVKYQPYSTLRSMS